MRECSFDPQKERFQNLPLRLDRRSKNLKNNAKSSPRK